MSSSAIADRRRASVRDVAGDGPQASIEAALAEVRGLPEREALAVCAKVRSLVDATEAAVLARHAEPDDVDGPSPGDRAAQRLQRDLPGVSNHQRRRARGRARTLKTNPELGHMMHAGELSSEQFDVLSIASAQSSGDAARDQSLIDTVARLSPEQGRKAAREWLDQRATRDQVNAEHERQKTLRRASRHRSQSGLAAITIEGPTADIDQLWSAAEQLADRYYHDDGGRDVPSFKHPRNPAQRLYDAMLALLRADEGARTRRGGRPAAVVNVPLDRLTGADPQAPAEIAGRGPIPDEVARRLLQNCDLYVQIVEPLGRDTRAKLRPEPLWQGRSARTATPGQYVSLAMRDNGCVTCNAPPEKCHAHHVVPFNAPAAGRTDIDNLALQCASCHRRLHDEQRTLVAQADGTWHTRPATADEIAPRRPGRNPASTPRPAGNSASTGPP